MDVVQQIRKYENEILSDIKFSNSLITLRKLCSDNSENPTIALAGLHSLRRIFIHYFDNQSDHLRPCNKNDISSSTSQFRNWFQQQYNLFVNDLKGYICNASGVNATSTRSELQMQVVAIKTMLEFVKREHILQSSNKKAVSFSRELYEKLLQTLVHMDDISFDILIMLRDEVFSLLDCVYYTHLILRKILMNLKVDIKKNIVVNKYQINNELELHVSSRVVIKNILDLLRMIAFENVEELVDEANAELENMKDADIDMEEQGNENGNSSSFLLVSSKNELELNSDFDSDSDSESEEESESDGDEVYTSKKRKLIPVTSKSSKSSKSNKTHKNLNRAQQLLDLNSQKKAFSNVWLTLLSVTSSIGYSQTQISDKHNKNNSKLILKHISEYVIPYLSKPLLLADYLSECYKQGCCSSNNTSISNSEHSTTVAILALESLFKLIVEYNLDYPSFFISLYQLTSSLQVFNSKYKHKFLKLLHMSLQSTNLPAYLAAAFIKKLMFVSCQGGSSTCGRFCITQSAALLRAHPQCMVLLHSKTIKNISEFDYAELNKLENSNSLHTSLFEIEALKNHFYPPIAELAEHIQNKYDVTKANTPLALSDEWKVEPYCNDTYTDLIDHVMKDSIELTAKEKKRKYSNNSSNNNGNRGEDDNVLIQQGAALNHRISDVLFTPDSLGGICFGK